MPTPAQTAAANQMQAATNDQERAAAQKAIDAANAAASNSPSNAEQDRQNKAADARGESRPFPNRNTPQ